MEVRKRVLRVPQALVFSHSWRNDMTKSSGKMRAIGNESGDKNIRNQVSEKRDGNQTMKEREKNLKEKAKKREEMSTTAPHPPDLVIKTKKANKSLLCSGARTSNKLFNLPNYPETMRLM